MFDKCWILGNDFVYNFWINSKFPVGWKVWFYSENVR